MKNIIVLFILTSTTLNLSAQNNNQSPCEDNSIDLFNGENLDDWTGDKTWWSVKNGMIIGETKSKKKPEQATWIVTKANTYDNFEITAWVKLTGDANRNSGIYYRGEWNEDNEVVGYEIDLGGWGEKGDLWWGELHDPYRRTDLWIKKLSLEELETVRNKKGWNFVRIRAEGNHFQHWVNGVQTVDWYETDVTMQKSGFIGLQLHNRSKFKVHVRGLKLTPLK